MNESERLVRIYLDMQGCTAIVHEPDGQVPPDFSIDGRIAVEVRRLNQNESTPDGYRGLEETAEPLYEVITKVFNGLGPPTTGVSWFVFYTFSRPLLSWRELERSLAETLRVFQHEPSNQLDTIRINKGFTLRFYRASKAYPTCFVLGGISDLNDGGFIIPEMVRNLRICIQEKSCKVGRFLNRYPEWWLALADRISYGGLSESDRHDLRALVSVDPPWKKIIIVNPLNPAEGFEL